ncbi:MAG: porin family protein [Prevotella sp.]|jgi:hypothetical protein|nr:porin family protein [Prevotella sp.]
MKKLLFIIFLLASTSAIKAQDDPEYLMEVGAGLGMVSYEGDFNGSILKDMQPMASLLMRRNFNPYMGLRIAASYGKLKGKSTDADTYYPDYQQSAYDFNNSLVDVSLTYEYNFWPYGTGRDYRGAKRITPFVFGGLGATYVSGGDKNVFTANVPLGLGIKYKIGERLNLGVEWAMHFSLSDKLDGVKDPYYVKSSGLFKNTDCYSALQVTLTYSFMAKCRTCNNDD